MNELSSIQKTALTFATLSVFFVLILAGTALTGLMVMGLLKCLHVLFPSVAAIPHWDVSRCWVCGAAICLLRYMLGRNDGGSSQA